MYPLESGEIYRAPKTKESLWKVISMKLRTLILHLAVCISMALMISFTSCRKPKIEVSAVAVSSTIKTDKPYLKVFIENSGSMDGYMCDGSQLKDAIYDYVSDLNRYTERTELYYINSDTIPYKGSLTSYIKNLNPVSFKVAGGNTANTDLGDIFSRVLSTVNDSTVVIFVSDCILDLPNKDTRKFLTSCEIQIKNEVVNTMKRLPDLGIEILKLSSDFNGKYYQTDGKVVYLQDVKRPYYVWIIGDKNYLARFNSKVPLSLLNKYNFEEMVAFSTLSEGPFDIFNRTLSGKVVLPVGNGYRITLLADFRTTLQPEENILDITNYTFTNPKLTVEEVHRISAEDSPYTHYVNFILPKETLITQEFLTFAIPPIPLWIEESNDDYGTNISVNLSKTTGIKYLIQGVADAYKNEKALARMNFNVKTR